MGRRHVSASATSSARADELWSGVRNFCAPWHPLVDRMWPETQGGLVRAFTVVGEATVYRERLTWFSDHLRELSYTHLEGITGARRYDGTLSVAPEGEGSRVTMSAEIDADAPRLDQIAEGTQAVFDVGVAAAANIAPAEQRPVAQSEAPLQDRLLPGVPRLSLRSADGPADTLCLFLHGIGGWRGNWDAQLRALAGNCRAVALDLRGYGDSDLGPAPSGIEDYCADILRVRDAMRPSRMILCGLSYGAWIATSFALRHPEALDGLVLSGGCTGMSEADEAEREAFRAAREAPLDAGKAPADFTEEVLDVITGPEITPAARAQLKASMEAIPAGTYRDALRCFTNPPEKFDFSRLNVPALLMTGAHDRLAPPAEIESVARRIWAQAARPDVRFEVIAGAGHVCNVERPEAYNRILQEFVARLARG